MPSGGQNYFRSTLRTVKLVTVRDIEERLLKYQEETNSQLRIFDVRISLWRYLAAETI
jgi:hypothetical protein